MYLSSHHLGLECLVIHTAYYIDIHAMSYLLLLSPLVVYTYRSDIAVLSDVRMSVLLIHTYFADCWSVCYGIPKTKL